MPRKTELIRAAQRTAKNSKATTHLPDINALGLKSTRVYSDGRRKVTMAELRYIKTLAGFRHSAAGIGWLLDPPRTRAAVAGICRRYGVKLRGKSGAPRGNHNRIKNRIGDSDAKLAAD